MIRSFIVKLLNGKMIHRFTKLEKSIEFYVATGVSCTSKVLIKVPQPEHEF